MQRIKTDRSTEVTFIPTSHSFGTVDYWTVEFSIQGREPLMIEVHECQNGWYVPGGEYPDAFNTLAIRAVETAEQMADQEEKAARQLAETAVVPVADIQRVVQHAIAAGIVLGLAVANGSI